MINDWKFIKETKLFEDNVLKVKHIEYAYSKVNDSMPFTVLEMSNWATIVPITSSGNFLIVKQFRAGTAGDTYEFPGGGIAKGEEASVAAKRELSEETGAETAKLVKLGVMDPNPAFMSNKCFVFLALGCEIVGDTKPDKFEDVEVIEVTPVRLSEMIKEGSFSQSISLGAYSLYLNHGK